MITYDIHLLMVIWVGAALSWRYVSMKTYGGYKIFAEDWCFGHTEPIENSEQHSKPQP